MGRPAAQMARRRKTASDLRDYRRASGLCVSCGIKAESGKRRCKRHILEARVAAKKHLASVCGRENRKIWRRTVGRFRTISALVQRQGKEWGLSEETWWAIVAMPCFYCGLENNSGSGAGMDRLDNSKGYVSGNVVSCCKECNTARMDNFSPEEMKVIGRAIKEVKLARIK